MPYTAKGRYFDAGAGREDKALIRKYQEQWAAADRAIEALAAALKAAVYLLDPGKLILYGAIFEHPYYLSRLRAEMEIGVDRAHATPFEKSAYNGTLECAAAGLLAAERFLTNGGFRE